MNTATAHRTPTPVHLPAEGTDTAPRRRPPGFTVAAGAFYTCMAGIHIGVATSAPESYAWYGENASLEVVSRLWADVFMAHPQAWGLAAAALEVALGVLLLVGGRAAKLGWLGIIAFQVALVGLGWGFLLWSVPASLALAAGARHDWPLLEGPRATL